MHEFTSPKTYRFVFWILCSLLNQEYTALFCETLPNHENELMRDLQIKIIDFNSTIICF